MKKVFVDTAYGIAWVRPDDPWADPALVATDLLENVQFVTTEEVLAEFLTGVSKAGIHVRRVAAELVRELFQDQHVRVIAQSHDSFLRGLALYESRLDKSYSLADCISMTAMVDESISEILTPDHHFSQEGFSILMKS